MVGSNTDWDEKSFTVTKTGSLDWSGNVMVWNYGNEGCYGRRHPKDDADFNQWDTADTIKLASCNRGTSK